MNYHDSSPFANQLTAGNFWRLQLETLLETTDGIVLWGGWQKDWNTNTSTTDSNNWWFQTLDFIITHCQ